MKSLLIFLLLLIPTAVIASEQDYQLHIHVHYQKDSDSWNVNYELPIAVEHVAFSRQSNFDRRKLYKIDDVLILTLMNHMPIHTQPLSM